MRGDVTIGFGGREYVLRPEFDVADKFEAREGGLLKHYEALLDGGATLKARGYLLFLALKAGSDDDVNWTELATRKAIYEAGLWSSEMGTIEIELIMRLIYTPEQYQAKKDEEAAAQAAMLEALADSSDTPIASPQ